MVNTCSVPMVNTCSVPMINTCSVPMVNTCSVPMVNTCSVPMVKDMYHTSAYYYTHVLCIVSCAVCTSLHPIVKV